MIILYIILGVVFVLIVLFIIGLIVAQMAFKHKEFVPYDETNSIDKTIRFLYDEKYQDPNVYKQLHIKTKDGLHLISYYLKAENQNHKYVLLLHGYRGHPFEWSSIISKLHKEGFNVITVSHRANYSSDGKYFSMGKLEAEDGLLWIKHIIELDPQAQICVFGHSMGGHIAMLMASNPLPTNVKCFIQDCGYASLKDQLIHTSKNLYHFPFTKLLVFLGEIVARIIYHFKFTDTQKTLEKCLIPFCMIHGDQDRFVPFYNLEKNYIAAKNCYKEKHIFEGATHCSCEFMDKERFYSIIINFMNKFMK